MRKIIRVTLSIVATVLFGGESIHAAEPPRIIHKDGRFALFVDGKPYLMLGAQMSNSSEWPSTLPAVWAAVERIHANTLGAPVYWEQIEAKPGTFDFANVDELIREARTHQIHLLLLWFGGSKNGQMHYAPEWVKTNPKKYPRLTDSRGHLLDILDDNAPENLEADKLAFTKLMSHLKQVDGEEHTVLMVQVENEAGPYYADRDYTDRGNELFAEPVPKELLEALHKQPGTWHEVFGDTDNETFALWSEARYINALAQAGKKEFDLPMYINIAAVNTPNRDVVNHMLDVWKAGAPSIDVVGADLYDDFPPLYEEMLQSYARLDNPLWISETGMADSYAKYLFSALGRGAIGFSPFGIDHSGWNIPVVDEPKAHGENYALLGRIDI